MSEKTNKKLVNVFVPTTKRFPDHQTLITCTTQTGSETIKRLYGDSVLHQYMPFDLRLCIKRFLKNWKPEITFILETEIWPNLINLLHVQKRKVFLVNGRMSEKSFNRYKLVLPILDNVFSKLDFTICQGTKDLKRFIELGVNQDRVIKDYSFKFDSLSIQNERDNFENKGFVGPSSCAGEWRELCGSICTHCATSRICTTCRSK